MAIPGLCSRSSPKGEGRHGLPSRDRVGTSRKAWRGDRPFHLLGREPPRLTSVSTSQPVGKRIRVGSVAKSLPFSLFQRWGRVLSALDSPLHQSLRHGGLSPVRPSAASQLLKVLPFVGHYADDLVYLWRGEPTDDTKVWNILDPRSVR